MHRLIITLASTLVLAACYTTEPEGTQSSAGASGTLGTGASSQPETPSGVASDGGQGMSPGTDAAGASGAGSDAMPPSSSGASGTGADAGMTGDQPPAAQDPFPAAPPESAAPRY